MTGLIYQSRTCKIKMKRGKWKINITYEMYSRVTNFRGKFERFY